MLDLLIPRTDAGVFAQLAIASALFVVLVVRFWANADARILIIGLYVAAVAFMGVRALH